MQTCRLTIFKLIFLMILSLKVSYAIYQNISVVSNSIETAYVLDLDESEKEEKQETDESKKIHQNVKTHGVNSLVNKSNFNSIVALNYKVLHLEFTTPPPEIG